MTYCDADISDTSTDTLVSDSETCDTRLDSDTLDSGLDSDSDHSENWLDQFMEWNASLDEESELPIPLVVRIAQDIILRRLPLAGSTSLDIPISLLLCHTIRVHDPDTGRNVLISRAYTSERRADLAVRFTSSPPVAIDSWSPCDHRSQPSWMDRPLNDVTEETCRATDVIPHFTMLAFEEPLNDAKSIGILQWTAGVDVRITT
ncbi:hypothetical protein JVT61DRAFT_1858 [Boletus reticuloceps]|uniref:Uncharacterized protein n=1 Tax=Boletus reticuloceps TaxID=495285 RepID=A0A8I2YT14_9AGAM|nr:hypothetical protein JVT61DRAFT_1858 [Boletus reticuloceps]